MKVVSINLGNTGSTGGIARNIKKYAKKQGIQVYTAYPASSSTQPLEDHDIVIGRDTFRKINRKFAYLTGYNGCFSPFATYQFIEKTRKISPDIIHLHNLHHSYCNLPMLFKYIKESKAKVVWTLHDCWAFTGQCPYFTMVKCERWKTGCHDCSQYHLYPEAKVDKTALMWEKKKKWFTGIDNLHIVTPSQWLADLVNQSYLSGYDVRVINNGIDTDVFKPVTSDFKSRNQLEDKKIILGVAFGWGERKGYDIFLKLADDLPDDYKIVLVGNVGTLQRNEKILYINRTHDQQELAALYSCADVLANPTREENFPTVNIEALACGTPVITFNTGGSPEIPDPMSGCVVNVDDYNGFKEALIKCVEGHFFSEENCVKRAQTFTVENMLRNYINLYNSI